MCLYTAVHLSAHAQIHSYMHRCAPSTRTHTHTQVWCCRYGQAQILLLFVPTRDGFVIRKMVEIVSLENQLKQEHRKFTTAYDLICYLVILCFNALFSFPPAMMLNTVALLTVIPTFVCSWLYHIFLDFSDWMDEQLLSQAWTGWWIRRPYMSEGTIKTEWPRQES